MLHVWNIDLHFSVQNRGPRYPRYSTYAAYPMELLVGFLMFPSGFILGHHTGSQIPTCCPKPTWTSPEVARFVENPPVGPRTESGNHQNPMEKNRWNQMRKSKNHRKKMVEILKKMANEIKSWNFASLEPAARAGCRKNPDILLMEEILHHLGCMKPCK